MMNRLRKAPPPPLSLAPKVQHHAHGSNSASRTMMYASMSNTIITTSPSPQPTPVVPAHVSVAVKPSQAANPPIQPSTRGEQYWAARALTAETMLTASTMYQEQLRVMKQAGDVKHSEDMATLNHQHELRHSKLERFSMLLMTWLLAMVAVLVYLLARGHTPQVHSRWMSPLHFTIPILSPFTSVTENETSTLSTRTTVLMILAASCLAYGCITYWLKQRRR